MELLKALVFVMVQAVSVCPALPGTDLLASGIAQVPLILSERTILAQEVVIVSSDTSGTEESASCTAQEFQVPRSTTVLTLVSVSPAGHGMAPRGGVF